MLTRSAAAAAFACAALIAAPALAQPGGEVRTEAAAEAAPDVEAAPAQALAAPEPAEAPAGVAAEAAAAAPGKAALRVGLRVRAASGAPVGEVARVTPAGVVVRMEVRDQPVLKLIAADQLEVRGAEAVTDLTVAELEGLPAAR